MTKPGLHIPTIETARLRLRAPAWQDYEAYCAFRVSERSRGVGGPFPRSEAFGGFCALAGHWHVRGFGRWIVADRASDQALGLVGLFYPEDWPEPEIAWSLFDGAEGRGYALEAALAARSYAYDALGWTRVISCILPDNHRSISLAKRMGAVVDSVFQHPGLGALTVWRHLPPEGGGP